MIRPLASGALRGALLRSLFAAAIVAFAPIAGAAFTPGEPLLDVTDPVLLNDVEGAGFRFADALGAPEADTLAGLYEKSAGYRQLADAVAADVNGLRAEMKANGRPLFEVTDGNVGRVMDLRWLRSPHARVRLVGVVNRLDKRDFDWTETCGETRFIYRMAYSIADPAFPRPLASRMPFNVNVVYAVPRPPGGDCANAARAWTPDRALAARERLAWLRSGPLDKTRLGLKQIEVNAQIVRFPSGQETEFGGQAAYAMRVFRTGRANGALTLTPKPLENTPDVARLKADPVLKARLAAFLRSDAANIDRGVFVIPDEFLATKATSFSTFGSARLANHPFTQLFGDDDFTGVDFGALSFVKRPKAMLERLDNATCMGCHQANATAGFHFIGFDDASTSSLNLLKTAVSPHYHADARRRDAYARAVADGRAPILFRPLSSAPPGEWTTGATPIYALAGAGMPCLANGARGAFAGGWSCQAGLRCQTIGGNPRAPVEFGQCLLADDKKLFSGHPCLVGEIVNGSVPYNDKFSITRQINSFAPKPTRTAFNCRPPKIGVPAGIAYRQCTEDDRVFAGFASGRAPPAEICGMAGGKLFDDCVATNNFNKCLKASVVRGNRPTCGRDSFCREDFMCQGFPEDVAHLDRVKDYGFCSPTYFLFQMRIDGHPDPMKKV